MKTPLLSITLLSISLSAHAFSGNGGERGGRPYRQVLSCRSIQDNGCTTIATIGALAGDPLQANISRGCGANGTRKIEGAIVIKTRADFRSQPYSPLIYAGNGFRISAAIKDVPRDGDSLSGPTSAITLIELSGEDGTVKEEAACELFLSADDFVPPTYGRDRIESLQLVKNGSDPFQATLEITYWEHCAQSLVHPKLHGVYVGNDNRCDRQGNCVGSTGDLVGVEAEILAIQEHACMGADTKKTISVSLADVMIFHGLPNDLDSLRLAPLQPQD